MYEGGFCNNGVDWEYFDKFENIIDKYMPFCGEGDTMASQIVTAINKLIYKWYNDGDIFDNTYNIGGWCNDLTSYANWLYDVVGATMLDDVKFCYSDGQYERLLKELADTYLDFEVLERYNKMEKIGTIYDCDGKFKIVEYWECEEW